MSAALYGGVTLARKGIVCGSSLPETAVFYVSPRLHVAPDPARSLCLTLLHDEDYLALMPRFLSPQLLAAISALCVVRNIRRLASVRARATSPPVTQPDAQHLFSKSNSAYTHSTCVVPCVTRYYHRDPAFLCKGCLSLTDQTLFQNKI